MAFQIVLTKADGVGPGALEAKRQEAIGLARSHPAADPEVFVTSAERGAGIAEVREALAGLVGSMYRARTGTYRHRGDHPTAEWGTPQAAIWKLVMAQHRTVCFGVPIRS